MVTSITRRSRRSCRSTSESIEVASLIKYPQLELELEPRSSMRHKVMQDRAWWTLRWINSQLVNNLYNTIHKKVRCQPKSRTAFLNMCTKIKRVVIQMPKESVHLRPSLTLLINRAWLLVMQTIWVSVNCAVSNLWPKSKKGLWLQTIRLTQEPVRKPIWRQIQMSTKTPIKAINQ